VVYLREVLGEAAGSLPGNEHLGEVVSDEGLYRVFNVFKYLMLCLTPLAFYFGARRLGVDKVGAAFCGASTMLVANNFQYGVSWESIIWRGSGMYSQLWGMFFLPLAVGFFYEAMVKRKNYFWAGLFVLLTLASQLGFGLIVGISCFMILVVSFIDLLIGRVWEKKTTKVEYKKLLGKVNIRGFLILFLLIGVSLAYWLVPLFLNSEYHNHSVWDDLNKFNSFGARTVISRLFNGEVFDYGRKIPTLTFFVFLGFFVSLSKYFESVRVKKRKVFYLYLPVLFVTWVVFYFGRTTWGEVIDLIPMSESMHWHRVINGVHLAGFFLLGIGVSGAISFLSLKIKEVVDKKVKIGEKAINIGMFLIVLGVFFPAGKERWEYARANTEMIVDYNEGFLKEWKDLKKIQDELRNRPKGRIFAGKPGQWGGDFKIGGQSVFMNLSIAGFDVLGFLPETWSANSDIEQFFDEDNPNQYQLFDIRYVVAPEEKEVPKFFEEVKKEGRFVLYEIPSVGVFDVARIRGTIYTDKRAMLNFNHVLIESKPVEEMNLWKVDYKKPGRMGKEDVKTVDWGSYKTANGITYSLFEKNPFKDKRERSEAKFWDEEVDLNSYRTKVELESGSDIILKATYHPFWQVKVDGKEKEAYMISPSLMGVWVDKGEHEIVFEYKTKGYKYFLMVVSLLGIVTLISTANKKVAKKIFD